MPDSHPISLDTPVGRTLFSLAPGEKSRKALVGLPRLSHRPFLRQSLCPEWSVTLVG